MQGNPTGPTWGEPPSVTGWLRDGWHAFRAEAGVFVMATLAYLVISLTPTLVMLALGRRHWWEGGLVVWLSEIALGVALLPLRVGLSLYALALLRGRRPDPVELLAGYSRPWPLVATTLLLGLMVACGFLLLLVPGVILALGLLFAPIFVVDRGAGPVGALRESWEVSRGARWRLLGLCCLLGLLAGPLVVFTCGLGVLVLAPLAAAALSAAYLDLCRRKGMEDSAPEPSRPADPLAVR